MLFTMLLVATFAEAAFEISVLYGIGRPARIWIFSHPGVAAVVEFILSFWLFIFTGAGTIVGLANIASSIPFDIFIFVARHFVKDRAIVTWGPVFWFIKRPMLMLISKSKFNELQAAKAEAKRIKRVRIGAA